ncbi:MAG TPA: PIN domain-containing protein [Phycicoccus sp.]|nr:PIN domain-containing protein [Phycicoccus sp.]
MLIDTGPLVAAALTRDRQHRACVDLFTRAHWAGERLLIPAPVVSEVGYLLEREGGPRVEAAFAQSLADQQFVVVDLLLADWRRVAELLTTYSDLPLGLVDASVVAVAERLGVTEIATLDRRHFTILRPRHVGAFTLIPE